MNLLSRSTWACELKYTIFWYNTYINKVTLHVSVWVEMTETEETPTEEEVTLHVSVWVEILGLQRFNYHFVSRSTWACELK